jgi:hypothetical protein
LVVLRGNRLVDNANRRNAVHGNQILHPYTKTRANKHAKRCTSKQQPKTLQPVEELIDLSQIATKGNTANMGTFVPMKKGHWANIFSRASGDNAARRETITGKL